jgi:hypothetical protein
MRYATEINKKKQYLFCPVREFFAAPDPEIGKANFNDGPNKNARQNACMLG